jgi:hypothetical protein
VRPYFKVEAALYRFRVVNTADSHFYALSLTGDRAFHQLGSDQGLLAAPVRIQKLIIAPGVGAGQSKVVHNRCIIRQAEWIAYAPDGVNAGAAMKVWGRTFVKLRPRFL